MRRIFIGDIQGCRVQLEEILSACSFRPGVDVLHPLGDLVNKGPDSIGVLTLLREYDAQCVLGNHDIAWLQRGRIEDRKLSRWLATQPVVRVMDDLIQVHAGLHPRWTDAELRDLNEEQTVFATTVRYCDREGRRPETDWPPPKSPFQPWDDFYHGTRRVVFGHWARRGLVRTDRVIGLDTGCVYGGRLTAWIAEEDRTVQVKGPPR